MGGVSSRWRRGELCPPSLHHPKTGGLAGFCRAASGGDANSLRPYPPFRIRDTPWFPGFSLFGHSRDDVVVWCAILAAIRLRRTRDLGFPPCSGRTWADRCRVWRFPLYSPVGRSAAASSRCVQFDATSVTITVVRPHQTEVP